MSYECFFMNRQAIEDRRVPHHYRLFFIRKRLFYQSWMFFILFLNRGEFQRAVVSRVAMLIFVQAANLCEPMPKGGLGNKHAPPLTISPFCDEIAYNNDCQIVSKVTSKLFVK